MYLQRISSIHSKTWSFEEGTGTVLPLLMLVEDRQSIHVSTAFFFPLILFFYHYYPLFTGDIRPTYLTKFAVLQNPPLKSRSYQ
jgi:hypothetical protein